MTLAWHALDDIALLLPASVWRARRCYRAGDGNWFFLACANKRFFCRMMEVVGLKHLVTHPDAADAWVFTNQADAPRDLLVPQLEATFGSKPRAHWLQVLQEADVPVAPIQSRDEFFASQFVTENDMSVTVEHPLHGQYVAVMLIPWLRCFHVGAEF